MSLLNIPWVRLTSVMLRTAYTFGSQSLSVYTDELHWTFRSPVSIADGMISGASSLPKSHFLLYSVPKVHGLTLAFISTL